MKANSIVLKTSASLTLGSCFPSAVFSHFASEKVFHVSLVKSFAFSMQVTCIAV